MRMETEENKEMKEKKRTRIKWWIPLIFILIVGLWVSYIFIMNHSFRGDGDLSKPGTFGDMFGALNTLFTGLALAGVIISNVLQNQDLKLQREEIEQNRVELKRNADELAEQSKNMKLQRFETTFFNMIDAHINIINSIKTEISIGGSTTNEIRLKYTIKDYTTVTVNARLIQRLIELNIKSQFNNWNSKLTLESVNNLVLAYTNHLFILQHLVNSKFLSEDDKNNYADIFKSQLSSEVLFLYKTYLDGKFKNGDEDAQRQAILISRFNF